jgi:hypothetical protein
MAETTEFLKLQKPINNEFQDIWDEPMNANFDAIDLFAKTTNAEILAARGDKASLAERLDVSLDPEGLLLPAPEVVAARNSFLYGDENAVPEDFDLAERLLQGDRDVHQAREGFPTLRESLGRRNYLQDAIWDGAKDVDGFPTWMGFTAADVQIDGSTTELEIFTGGRLQKIRTLEQVTISGAAGTYFVFAQFAVDGKVVVDGDSGSPPPASGQGTIGSDGSKLRIFEDLTVDFTAEDIVAGDILRIVTDPQGSVGDYIIDEVAPSANVNRLKIRGIFTGVAVGSVDYEVRNPWQPTLGFDAAITPLAGKVYIGEAAFDGAAVTEVFPLHFKNVFLGDWRAVDVSGGSPDFEEIWDHNLLTDQLETVIQVSTVNDGSAHIEELSLAGILNTLGVDVDNGTLAFNQGAFSAGTGDSSHGADSLTGDVAGVLTGLLQMNRSITMKANRNRIWVKNPISTVFYKDYAGAVQQVGFIRVIVRKRIS